MAAPLLRKGDALSQRFPQTRLGPDTGVGAFARALLASQALFCYNRNGKAQYESLERGVGTWF